MTRGSVADMTFMARTGARGCGSGFRLFGFRDSTAVALAAQSQVMQQSGGRVHTRVHTATGCEAVGFVTANARRHRADVSA